MRCAMVPTMRNRDIPATLVRPFFERAVRESGVSANEFARQLGMPNTTISRPLKPGYTGKVRPKTVAAVAAAAPNVPMPPELAALVPVDRSSDIQLSVKIADRIPLGRALGPDDRARLVAEIMKVVQAHRPGRRD
jgi:hypothetical protein